MRLLIPAIVAAAFGSAVILIVQNLIVMLGSR